MPRANQGASIKQADNGVWYIHWTELGRSRRRSTGTADRKVAQKILAAFIIEKEAADDPSQCATIGIMLDQYLREHIEPNANSKDTARNAIGYLRAHFDDYPVNDLEPRHVEGYVRDRKRGKIGWFENGQERGYRIAGDSSIRRELGVLVAAYNYAAKTRRIRKGAIPHIPMPPAAPVAERWLTQAEADKLLTAALNSGDRWQRSYLFCMIGLHTAARKAAIEELTWEQVDFTRKIINLNPPGRRQVKLKKRAIVPMSDKLHAVLLDARKLRDEYHAYHIKRTGRPPEKDYVLPGGGTAKHAFAAAVERSGLQKVTPHVLRHTWATWAAQRGVSMWDIAGVLGDTVQTVTDRYLHHSPEHLRSAVNY